MQNGEVRMTKPLLKKLCKDNGLYGTPSINDKIYLHYKGFPCIENLDEYTDLKVIWLEGNGLQKIEGLENQKMLKTLYLQENIFDKIEGLDAQVELDTLNLSKNYITKVENIAHMKVLSTLNLAHNRLKTYDDLKEILTCPSIQVLDLQQNRLEDPAVIDLFAQIPDLRVLYMMGNPCVKQITHYRKMMIYKCKQLKYLDDRPVFDEERRRVDVWGAAFELHGFDAAQEAEREELRAIRREKDEQDERNYQQFSELMKAGQEKRRIREAEEAANKDAQQQGVNSTDDDDDKKGEVMAEKRDKFETYDKNGRKVSYDYSDEVSPFSGERIVKIPESTMVKEAREKRWGHLIDPTKSSNGDPDAAPPLPPASGDSGVISSSADGAPPLSTPSGMPTLSMPPAPPSSGTEGNANKNDIFDESCIKEAPVAAEPLSKGNEWRKIQIEGDDDDDDDDDGDNHEPEIGTVPATITIDSPIQDTVASAQEELNLLELD